MNNRDAHISREALTDVTSSHVKSATRVLDLFEFLSRWDSEKTHTEIADELGIPKSSLTQLLKTLLQRGYLAYAPISKGYRLGPSIASLAGKVHGNSDLVNAAGPILTWLANETQETCAINLIKGDQSEVMASAIGPHRLNYTMRQGDVAPLYATSGGKALLAFLPTNMLDEYMNRVTFETITANTITSLEELRSELENVRRSGFAYVTEEFTPGIAGIAVPILSPSGYPLAALNVATPISRFDAAKKALCEETLLRATATLKRKVSLA
ncbi:IclR family transcriptional regulator (plasmid) [Rhizobium leguminosarum]